MNTLYFHKLYYQGCACLERSTSMQKEAKAEGWSMNDAAGMA